MTQVFSGTSYAPFTTTGVQIKAGGGRAVRLVVTATVTGAITLYDSLTATGQIIWVSPANPTVGTSVVIDCPFDRGLFCTPGSAGAGIIVFS